jgi:hypothetical protein
VAEERLLHEQKLAKMEAEMKMVFQQKVMEKEAKLKQSEEELYARHREMKESLEKQRLELEDKRRRLESGRPLTPTDKPGVSNLLLLLQAMLNDACRRRRGSYGRKGVCLVCTYIKAGLRPRLVPTMLMRSATPFFAGCFRMFFLLSSHTIRFSLNRLLSALMHLFTHTTLIDIHSFFRYWLLLDTIYVHLACFMTLA